MGYKLFKHNGKLLRGDNGLLGYEPPVALKFSAPETFSISVANPGWNGTMEYSTDTQTWNEWSGSEISGTAVYIRGTGNTKVTGSSPSYKWTLTGFNIACTGNIETLLDYATVDAGEHPTMANYCYSYMFYNCTSLTTAPALPATTLAEGCYSCMFEGCTNLTAAPALPATTMAEGCYYGMFEGCTSLTTAPALPATTLADYCYDYMFIGCTSLTTAPALPATTMAEGCYYGMFAGCTSLTTAPALPATTMAEGCYYGMFADCTSLKFSATQTDEYTQEYRIPTSGEGTTASDALTGMFASTGGAFTDDPEINTTYYLHKDCSIV